MASQPLARTVGVADVRCQPPGERCEQVEHRRRTHLSNQILLQLAHVGRFSERTDAPKWQRAVARRWGRHRRLPAIRCNEGQFLGISVNSVFGYVCVFTWLSPDYNIVSALDFPFSARTLLFRTRQRCTMTNRSREPLTRWISISESSLSAGPLLAHRPRGRTSPGITLPSGRF